MIILNTEHGLKSVESWQDILEMPNFTLNLNPNEVKLKDIIGHYKRSTNVTCGLSTCHQPHATGFIVITESGLITNIGQICGKTHFKVGFETLRKQYQINTEGTRRREAIRDGQLKAHNWRQQISNIRASTSGADWAHKASRPLIQPSQAISQKACQALQACIHNRDGSLFTDRKATKAERDIAAAQSNRPTGPMFIREKVGEIKGISALFPEHDLRRLLVDELEPLLKELETANPDIMSHRALGNLSKRLATVDADIERAREALGLHQILLTSTNLEQLLSLIDAKEERVAFSAYLKTLPKNTPRG